MARDKSIRITKNDQYEYKRLVKNTKAKLRRIEKNYGIDLRSEIAIPKMEHFKSREVFNRWKGEIKSFNNKANTAFQFVKNDYGVVASKKEINDIRQNTKVAQNVAKQEITKVKNKPFISGGKTQGTVGQRMLQMKTPKGGVTIPKDFNFAEMRSRKRLEQVMSSMKRKTDLTYYDRRKEQMKTNFIEMLGKCFNSDANTLIKEVMNISADDFYELYLMYDEFSFEKYYNEKDVGVVDDAITSMLGITEAYNDGLINFDLKSIPNR